MITSWQESHLESNDISEEGNDSDDIIVRTKTKAKLLNCSNVKLGNELNGPIKVENMIVVPPTVDNELQTSKRADGDLENEFKKKLYNVGSIMQMFNPESLILLEISFKNNPRPDKVELDQLAQLTGSRRKMVKKWFAIERAKRKRELTLKEPVKAIIVIWTSWSKKFRRKVLLLGVLLVLYSLSCFYCIYYFSWYEVLVTTAVLFFVINSILKVLD